jgi:putative transposase
MDGEGHAIDNIFIKRLGRTVKYGNIYFQFCTDGQSLRKGLRIYYKFYNAYRFHQSLDYKRLIIIITKKKWHKTKIIFFGFLE